MNEFRHAVTPVVQRMPKFGRSEAMSNIVVFRRYSVYLEYVTYEQDLKMSCIGPLELNRRRHVSRVDVRLDASAVQFSRS